MKIEFAFKSFIPKQVPIPLSWVKFKNGNRQVNLLCVVDSGADFCTVPMPIGIMELGIDFNKNRAPYELVQEWHNLDKSDKAKLEEFINKIIEKKLIIPMEIGCACGKGTTSYLFAVEIEIGEFKKTVLVNWIDSTNVSGLSALLGRVGVFDQMDAVVFNTKEGKGFFEK
ncbi:MAG: hypothetical protein Q7K34_04855 [archaeon]|nr:hypothetical protein [archaeon]